MNENPNPFGGRASISEIKRMRRDNPSGWLELSMYETLALMIDAILDAPPEYSFTNPELASRAGVSDESVRNHIETLEELGIVSATENGNRYRVNDNSRVLREIFGLNDAINAIRSGASKTTPMPFEGLGDAVSRAIQRKESEAEVEEPEDQEQPPIVESLRGQGPLTA